MRSPIGACAWIAVALLSQPAVAHALTFRVVPNDGFGSKVLLIYDCGRIKEPETCSEKTTHFHSSDPQTLTTYWKQGPFDEVWLVSGGGDLEAGIEMANDLRVHAQAVRVPNARRLRGAGYESAGAPVCASSCTVAFMGGQFRSIDEGTTYKVHAASSVAWPDVESSLPAIRKIVELVNDKDVGLRRVLYALTDDSRQTARQLFTLFQDTLWLPLKSRSAQDTERLRREQELNQWEREAHEPLRSYSAAMQARDEAILELEGTTALQDIMMRMERQEMSGAIREIRALVPRLGRRADAALAMLESMFETSSILETNSMPRETLVNMGYVTEFVK